MKSLAIAALLASSAAAQTLDPADPPGGNFELSIWRLQLPVAGGSGVQEILPDVLASGYNSSWFSTAPDGAMAFWCPVTGATTPNSHYPRSELREAWTDGDWTFTGHHRLSAVCRVMQVPDNGRVIIGQIHGHADQSEIIKLYWDNGNLSAGVEPDRSSEVGLALGKAALGDTIAYVIDMQDGKLKVTVNGKTVNYDYTANTWKGDTYYFKAGVYVQDNTGSSTVGGRVRFYALTVAHNGVSVDVKAGLRAARTVTSPLRWDGHGVRAVLPGRAGIADGNGRHIRAFFPAIRLDSPAR